MPEAPPRRCRRTGARGHQFTAVRWGERRGSNPRPQEPQSCALPAELRPPLSAISYRSFPCGGIYSLCMTHTQLDRLRKSDPLPYLLAPRRQDRFASEVSLAHPCGARCARPIFLRKMVERTFSSAGRTLQSKAPPQPRSATSPNPAGRTDSQAKSRLLTPAGRAARVPSSCGRWSNERSRPRAGPSNPKRPRGALWIGAPGRTRTCYPRLRRPMLYPDELQALRRFLQVDLASLNVVVGAEGFEPPTPCSQSRCATRLRYAPIFRAHERPPWTRERDDTQEPECGQLPRAATVLRRARRIIGTPPALQYPASSLLSRTCTCNMARC